jgi:hypothetical protein
MTHTPLDARPLRDRLRAAAARHATGEPTTDAQKAAYSDGKDRHADGSHRPNQDIALAIYEDEGNWFIRGWADAAAMADSQTDWDQGLTLDGIPTGVRTTANGVRHAATRHVHPDATGRPDQFSWSCSCGAAGSYHRSSPLADAAFIAAREWAGHVRAVEELAHAEARHDFESGGRHPAWPCLACGQDRSAAVHR